MDKSQTVNKNRLTIDIDPELHRKLKVLCAAHDFSMKLIVVECIKSFVDNIERSDNVESK